MYLYIGIYISGGVSSNHFHLPSSGARSYTVAALLDETDFSFGTAVEQVSMPIQLYASQALFV